MKMKNENDTKIMAVKTYHYFQTENILFRILKTVYWIGHSCIEIKRKVTPENRLERQSRSR